MTRLIRRLKTEFFDIRFARFLLFGCATAAVNLVVGGVLYSHDAAEEILPYWAAVTIAGFLAMITGFVLNYFLNFRYQGRPVFAQFRTYVLIALSCIVITAAMAQVGLAITRELFVDEGFKLGPQYVSYEFASHFVAVGSVAVYSYMCHKYITFNVGFRGRIATVREARTLRAVAENPDD